MEQEWRKVLYLNQGYEDNFVPKSFLEDTKRNVFVRKYEYWNLVKSSAVIVQQLCVVSLFVLVWWYMSAPALIAPETVVFISMVASLLGYGLFIAVSPVEATKNAWNFSKVVLFIKWSALLLGLCIFFSPVLRTLTHTVSTDTVYAMTICSLATHLLFHDYFSSERSTVVASRSISFNSAVFAAVCLASRLDTTSHCFATVVLALQLFGLWPFLQTMLWKQQRESFRYLVHLVQMLISFAWVPVSVSVSVAFAISSLVVTFVFPMLLVMLQSQKDNVHGPWDEAVIDSECEEKNY